MTRSFFLASLPLATASALAQITPIDVIQETISPLYTLEDAGVKYVQDVSDPGPTINIYNEDLSVYRILTIPPAPVGYGYGHIQYVTEDLFDTDPATIEFVLTAYATPSDGLLFVIRQDGNILFQNAGRFFASSGSFFMSGHQPIVETDSGAILLLRDALDAQTSRFQLPGHLPCIPCVGGNMVGIGQNMSSDDGAGMITFPNPAPEYANVRYRLPNGTTEATFMLFDVKGSSRLSRQIDGTGSLSISTEHLAQGTYHSLIVTEKLAMPGEPLVVAR